LDHLRVENHRDGQNERQPKAVAEHRNAVPLMSVMAPPMRVMGLMGGSGVGSPVLVLVMGRVLHGYLPP